MGGFAVAVIILLFKNPKNQKVSNNSFISKLREVNLLSLFIFTGSLVCLLIALERGGTTYSWGDGRIIALLVVSGVTFGAFVALEVLQKGPATIPRAVILNRTVALCVVYAFCTSAAYNTMDYFVSRSKRAMTRFEE